MLLSGNKEKNRSYQLRKKTQLEHKLDSNFLTLLDSKVLLYLPDSAEDIICVPEKSGSFVVTAY